MKSKRLWLALGLALASLSALAQIPASEYSNENAVRNPETDWRALPIKVDRNDNYATGQKSVIRTLAIHPTNPNTVLAGGMLGGIWKSTDKAATWSLDKTFNLPFIGWVNHIEYSASDPQYVYAATDAGIIKSTDGGETWHFTSMNYSGRFPNINYPGDGYRTEYIWVAVSPSNPQHLVATACNPQGVDSRIAKSTDGGATWTETSFGQYHFVFSLKYHPTNANIVYALIKNGSRVEYHRSADGGATFTKTAGVPEYANSNNREIRAVLATTPANPDLVVYYLNVSDEGTAIFTSTDAGQTFAKACCGGESPLVNKANDRRDLFGENFSAVQIRWATTFAISNVDANHMAAATNIPPRFSYDGAQTWYWTPDKQDFTGSNIPTNVVSPTNQTTYVHGDIQCMVIRGNDVWVANDGGIVLSENGGQTYREMGDGIPVDMVLGFDNTAGSRDVMAMALDHNGVLIRDEAQYGEYWKPMGGGDASGASLNPIDDYWVYGIPSGSAIWERPKTRRHGPPSNSFTPSVTFGSGYARRYNNVIAHPNLHYTLYVIDYARDSISVATSTDNGATWRRLKALAPNGNHFAEVKISQSHPHVLYATIREGHQSKLWRSNNGGATWHEVNLASFTQIVNQMGIRNVEISSTDPGTIWVTLGGHQDQEKVLYTNSGGAYWQSWSEGLPPYEIYSLVHQRGTEGGVYVGTTYGVYYRNANMASWTKVGTNLPAVQARFLKINYAKGLIRIGSSRGVWEHSLYEPSAPQALISASTRQALGSSPMVQFASNSAVGSGATYQWTFPSGTPATSTEERPKVTYANPNSRLNCARLTVTDGSGESNTHTLSNFIEANYDDSQIITLTNVETKRMLLSTGEVFCGMPGEHGGWIGDPAVVGSDANYYNRANWYLEKAGEGYFLLRNTETHRYLFSTGTTFNGQPGEEGGWTGSPEIVGSDANYYNRALWAFEDMGNGTYLLRNYETKRLLLTTGPTIEEGAASEGGWTNAPAVVGADNNYYNRALWRIVGRGVNLIGQ